ncbi:MAG: CAP domain-containing protein [Planctomycetaceae bacterium]|nr:CAP domain-containing protein [Planctomycetaceae bacterium]
MRRTALVIVVLLVVPVWGAEPVPSGGSLSLQGGAKIGAALNETGVPVEPSRRGFQFSLSFQWSLQATWGPTPSVTSPSPPPAGLSADEAKLIELTNAERKKISTPAVRFDPVLMQVARGQSEHMARLKQISHELEGRTFTLRMKEAKYRALAAGEICAEGARDPQEAVADWLESPGHKETMLDAKYTAVGVGIAADADGRWYYTQVFAQPATEGRPAPPGP